MKRSVRLVSLVLGMLASGCGSEEPPDHPGADSTQAETAGDTVPPVPPEPQRGKLTTVSRGYPALTGAWPAEAGICSDASVFLLQARGEEVGVVVLLGIPESERLISYPVVWEPGPPEDGTSRVAAQVIPQAGALSYQASEGWVKLEELRTKAAGTFSVRLQQADGSEVVELAGSFGSVPVKELTAERCAFMPPSETE